MTHISNLCPYCNKNVTFSWVDTSVHGGSLDTHFNVKYKNENGIWALAACPSCKNCVLIQMRLDSKNNSYELISIKPNVLPNPSDKRIPDEIRVSLDEAKLCLSVGASMACSTMCRRTMQCACIEQGATKDDLKDQIKELADKQIITKQIADWAHSIRWVGNDGAHPNNKKVSKEDAEDILNLADQMMNIFYVMPAIAKKHQSLPTKV